MKKYFVVGSVLGHLTIMKEILGQKGWDYDDPNHILVLNGNVFYNICNENIEMIKYLTPLKEKNRLEIIEGIQERILKNCYRTLLQNPKLMDLCYVFDGAIGTISDVCGLANIYNAETITPSEKRDIKKKMMPLFRLTNDAKHYLEINNNIILYGWLPDPTYWNLATDFEWLVSKWFNGADLAIKEQQTLKGKTIICAHQSARKAHRKYNKKKGCFDIFKKEGVVLLNCDVIKSKKLGVYVIEGD